MDRARILISLTRELRSAMVTAAKRIAVVKRMAALWKRFIYIKHVWYISGNYRGHKRKDY